MENELTLIKDNWLELVGPGKDLPVPFVREIFLQECHVAGTMHVDDILVKTKDLAIDSELRLRREPDNPCDDLAIAVETAAGDRIGYVPKKYNPPYARLMDAGKLLVARVAHKELEDHWLNIRISIILRDI